MIDPPLDEPESSAMPWETVDVAALPQPMIAWYVSFNGEPESEPVLGLLVQRKTSGSDTVDSRAIAAVMWRNNGELRACDNPIPGREFVEVTAEGGSPTPVWVDLARDELRIRLERRRNPLR